MTKKMFKKAQGFTPVELAVVVGVGALAAAAFIFMATKPAQMAQLPPINVNVQPPAVTVQQPDVNVNVQPAKVSVTAPAVSRAPSAMAYTTPTQGDGETLAAIKAQGYVDVGVRNSTTGFIKWRGNSSVPVGFEPDIAGAFTAAIFGPKWKDNVKYHPLSADGRFYSLDENMVDVVFRTVTTTASRDSHNTVKHPCRNADGENVADQNWKGFPTTGCPPGSSFSPPNHEEPNNYGPVYFYDGQDILYDPTLVNSANDLVIAVPGGLTSTQNIIDWTAINGGRVVELPSGAGDAGMWSALTNHTDGVNAISTDSSLLIGIKLFRSPSYSGPLKLWLKDSGQPFLSKEPLAPLTREGDANWDNIVRWVIHALMQAEEEGVTQRNVQPGYLGSVGPKLGLSTSWAYDAIKVAGNYGEIYENNMTDGAFYPRGANESWVNGGLLYAPPVK